MSPVSVDQLSGAIACAKHAEPEGLPKPTTVRGVAGSVVPVVMSTRTTASPTPPHASERARAVARGWMACVRRAVGVTRRAPLTLAAVVLLWSVAVGSGSVSRGPAPEFAVAVGAGLGSVRAGHWWFPLSSMFWCSGLASYVASTVLILLVVPGVERRLGSLRAVALLCAIQILGVAVGLGLTWLIAMGGGRWGGQVVQAVALGPAGAVLGLALAASATLPTVWRRRLRVVLLVALAMFALYSGLLADLVRLSTGLVGLGLGAWAWRGTRVRKGYSKPEVRMLLALIVAASALGPLIAAIAHTHVGPLSLLRYVFASPPPDVATVQQICADPTTTGACVHLRARLRLNGVGPALMSAMPVMLLLAAAEGLRLGRRAAWLAAIGLNVALAILGVLLALSTATSPSRERLMIGPGHHVHAWLSFVLPLMQPVLVIVLLVATRRLFTVRAPAGTYVGWGRRVVYTLIAVSALYVAGSIMLATGYEPVPRLTEVIADLPTRFLPPSYLGASDPTFLPVQPATTVLYEWSGVLFWVVATAGALVTFTRTPLLAQASKGLVRELLAAGGGSSLSYPVTWPGNSYWFTEDHTAAVAYRVIGGVAVTTGDPIGDPDVHQHAIRGFIEYCQDHGWIPCLYAVGAEVAEYARSIGWHAVQVAEETVLPLGELTFTGKRWQNVRTALNNAKRGGIVAEWCRFSDAPVAITDQIGAISLEWVARKGVPEMGFTLGSMAELADDDVKLLIAVDHDRTVHAVTSWLPVYRRGQLFGYTLDFMRRRPKSFNGIMDFLIGSAARDFQADGMKILSLSGAPLARCDRGEPPARLQQVVDLLGRALEPIYGFQSLHAFKARFNPTYQPLYLTYPDPVALPKIGRAITRAYLPDLTLRQTAQLTHRLTHGLRRRLSRKAS
jgi:phosphatidylglycerol lysyltransferase